METKMKQYAYSVMQSWGSGKNAEMHHPVVLQLTYEDMTNITLDFLGFMEDEVRTFNDFRRLGDSPDPFDKRDLGDVSEIDPEAEYFILFTGMSHLDSAETLRDAWGIAIDYINQLPKAYPGFTRSFKIYADSKSGKEMLLAEVDFDEKALPRIFRCVT